MFKVQQKSEPSYLTVISDADSRKNMRKLYPSWSNGDEEGLVILPVQREYISMKTIINAKTTRHRKIQLLGHSITTDVAQVSKRAVSTANRFGAI